MFTRAWLFPLEKSTVLIKTSRSFAKLRAVLEVAWVLIVQGDGQNRGSFISVNFRIESTLRCVHGLSIGVRTFPLFSNSQVVLFATSKTRKNTTMRPILMLQRERNEEQAISLLRWFTPTIALPNPKHSAKRRN